MKPASGFTADDGTFFESAEECELYEAEQDMKKALERESEEVVEFFMNTVTNYYINVKRFVHAYEANIKRSFDSNTSGTEETEDEPVDVDAKRNRDDAFDKIVWDVVNSEDKPEPTVDERPPEHALTAKSPRALLELSTRRRGDVSYVGSSARSAGLPEQSEEHGPGVWERDA